MTEHQPTYLFVYGTLRADVRHPLHQMIREHARDRGPAVFQGRLYDLGAYPGVVDSDEPAGRVHGEVYEIISDPDRVFARLDAYEECGPGFAQPTEYLREMRTVSLVPPDLDRLNSAERQQASAARREVRAWIYLYNHSLDGAKHLANGDYLGK